MRGIVLALLMVLGLSFAWTSPTLAEKRVALVIGNDNYSALPDLNNARKDATDMAAKLKGLGFEVILKINARRRDMGRALAEFEGKLSSSQTGLVFYAGHGIQADGRNYLIPSDARIEVEEDLRYEGVDAKDILEAMGRSGASMNIVILDACRDNPLPKRTRSAARGLSVVGIPKGTKGTAVLYSAGEGQTAQDGPLGGNGVFTGELLKVLDQPGLTLEQVFKRVAKGVGDITHGKQRPWSLTSLQGDFYFRPVQAATSTTLGGGMTPEMMFWQSIQGSTDPADFEAYLNQYPNGTFAALAHARAAKHTPPQLPLTAGSVLVVRGDSIYGLSRRHGVSARAIINANGLKPPYHLRIGQRVTLPRGRDHENTTHERPLQTAIQPSPTLSPPSRPVRPAVGVYFRPGDTFRDCAECPEMLVIPAGRFRMGDVNGGGEGNEKPVHTVNIRYKFAIGKFEVTRGEFAAFIRESGHRMDDGCWYWNTAAKKAEIDKSKNWRNPGFRQTDRDPVVCVNWDDAKAYARWLGRDAGVRYRLLSEAEWEYMARAGSTSKYPFGDSENSLCEYGNAADRSTGFYWHNKACSDGHGEQTAPGGSFKPNAFGVYDTIGNAWEWTEDCWHGTYSSAPMNGKAWTTGGTCGLRVLRGGSWGLQPRDVRSAFRYGLYSDYRGYDLGFRVARTF
jgi:formylglycine-generating enzyme required for sulfatase activity